MSSSKTVFAKWVPGPRTKDSSLCPSPHCLLFFCPGDASSCKRTGRSFWPCTPRAAGRPALTQTGALPTHTGHLLPFAGIPLFKKSSPLTSPSGRGRTVTDKAKAKRQDWGCVAKDIKARPWLLQKPSKLLSTLTYSYCSIAQNIIKVPALRNCSCKLRTVQ